MEVVNKVSQKRVRLSVSLQIVILMCERRFA